MGRVILIVGLLMTCLACGEDDQNLPNVQVRQSATQLPPFDGQVGDDAWTNASRLNRRTCPDTTCGIVGQFFRGDRVEVLELQDGWARISRYYRPLCDDGTHEFVDSGRDDCTAENGFRNGRVAEWVSTSFLTGEQPPDPAEGAEGVHALVANSDDFGTYGDVFANAASQLIASGTCTVADFEEGGGWLKSTINHRDDPVYFAYCGGLTRQNRLYLNAETGEVFR